VDAAAIAARWSGFDSLGWEGLIDGGRFVVERGVAGDHRFVHGAHPDDRGIPSPETRAVHHLDAEADMLRCAPSEPGDPGSWRVVLDSVLFTIALLHGYEALHAGALATPDGAIAITAGSGGGKSTLLGELLGRGMSLMADDVLVLEAQEDEPPLAHPAPPLMTVPATRLAIMDAAGDLETISAIADERWLAVPVHPEPMTLKAIVVLERQDAATLSAQEPALMRIETPLAALLGALMAFPDDPDRQRARFELASTIAATVGIWRLSASLNASPAALADTLLAGQL
jgi:hypothetical protein